MGCNRAGTFASLQAVRPVLYPAFPCYLTAHLQPFIPTRLIILIVELQRFYALHFGPVKALIQIESRMTPAYHSLGLKARKSDKLVIARLNRLVFDCDVQFVACL